MRNSISTVWFFAKSAKKNLILSVFFELLSIGGSIVPFVCVYHILIDFFNGTQTPGQVLLWSGCCFAGYLVKAVAHGLALNFSHTAAYTVLNEIRLYIAHKLSKASLGDVQRQGAGKRKNLIVDHVETIELPLAHLIPEGAGAFVLPLCVFVYLAGIDWRMALVSFITVPLSIIPFCLSTSGFKKLYDDYMKASDRVNTVLVEYVEGIEVIKAFNQSGTNYEKYKKAVTGFREYTLAWFKKTYGVRTFINALFPSTLMGILPFGMYFYYSGTLAPEVFVISMLLSMSIMGSFMKMTMFINSAKVIEYAVNALKESMELAELPDSGKRQALSGFDISIKKVSFSYNDTLKVLKDIDLEIPSGSVTALVGPSGSGKSTMARLIARFWDVAQGQITIGGADIRDIPLAQLSETVSFVTQDNFLFNASILENIRMGDPSADDEQVMAAAKAAQCDEFIQRLDQGYHSLTGETGGKLSGGERQRIAIARAILKDAPIVILDEATAFTDPENEAKLQHSIAALTKGKTLLVIAHRLSTIKQAHKIVVLDKGRIEGIGTHGELLAGSGLYRSMWKSYTRPQKRLTPMEVAAC